MAYELADFQQIDHTGMVATIEPSGRQLLVKRTNTLAREQAFAIMGIDIGVAAISLQAKNGITRKIEIAVRSRNHESGRRTSKHRSRILTISMQPDVG